MSRWTPPRGDERDAGTTLVELLVVMVLTTIVLAAVGTVFVSATRSVRETQVRTSAQADARTAADAMSRSLRVAVTPPGGSTSGPFVSATQSSVSFYANLQRSAVTMATTGPAAAPVVRAGLQLPSLVTYAYDSSRQCITEARTPGVVNTTATASTTPVLWPPAGTTTKCLARTTVAPAFTYFSTSVIAASAPLPQTGSLPLSAAAANSVVSVQVDLTVTTPTAADVSPTRTSDRVTLVNVLASQAG